MWIFKHQNSLFYLCIQIEDSKLNIFDKKGTEISNDEVIFHEDFNAIFINGFNLNMNINQEDFVNYYSVGMLTIEEALADSLDDQGKVYWSAKAFNL